MDSRKLDKTLKMLVIFFFFSRNHILIPTGAKSIGFYVLVQNFFAWSGPANARLHDREQGGGGGKILYLSRQIKKL